MPDGTPVENSPVGDFAIGSSGDDLSFIGVIADLLEESGLEEALVSCEGLQVPDDARAIGAARDGLGVGRGDLDAPDSVSVLLDRGLHVLSGLPDAPHSDLPFHAPSHQSPGVGRGSQRGHPVSVRVTKARHDGTSHRNRICNQQRVIIIQ